MSREMLINVTPREVRVALAEQGIVQELHIERTERRGIVGNIYRGRVTRVLPGMQAAFVEIGLPKAGFLHMSDLHDGQVLINGMDILVQILKDPLGSKGPRLTARVSLPSRRLVFMPGGSGIGVSARIDDDERARLRLLLADMPDVAVDGFIVRTAAEGAAYDALRAEMLYLRRLWETIEANAASAGKATLAHAELPLVLRMVRDLAGTQVDRIIIDSREAHAAALEFAAAFLPELLPRIEHHPGERPLFDVFDVDTEIARALDRRVNLKSGGYMVIDQTEALVTIDVNTGGYVGHKNLEETAFKTNLEAAQEIARQLRLRNLGGIIIIDFIDMEDQDHRAKVLEMLETHLSRDHASTRIGDVSPLGLVEMTRKRTRESLAQVLCEPCTACSGRGNVKTVESVCYEIFREVLREARQYEPSSLAVIAAVPVVDCLLDQEAQSLAELIDFIGRPVHLQVGEGYPQDRFDVVPT